MKFKYEGIFLLLVMAFLLRTCPKQKPIFHEDYQAIKCGLSSNSSTKNTFVFDKKNGYLYYFDIDDDSFLPKSRKINQEGYFNSMEEFSSRLEINKLLGNKLIVIYIDYLDQDLSNIVIVKKTINLRWLVMYTSIQNREEEKKRRRDDCIWLDPKEVDSSLLIMG